VWRTLLSAAFDFDLESGSDFPTATSKAADKIVHPILDFLILEIRNLPVHLPTPAHRGNPDRENSGSLGSEKVVLPLVLVIQFIDPRGVVAHGHSLKFPL
jgi:hypothetical protein